MLMTQTTWGMTGTQFLWAYGALSACAAIAILLRWWQVTGTTASAGDEAPELGVYELATLSDGPQLAITSAASQLHADRLIRTGAAPGTLEAVGELEEHADVVERAVFETVRAAPGIGPAAMRRQVEAGGAVRAMTDELTAGGLLIASEQRRTLKRRILLLGGLLTLLGVVRIVAGALEGRPVGWLVVAVALVLVASVRLAARVPVATRRGRVMLERSRAAHDELRRHPPAGDGALAAALFGAGALWLADPDLAAALGVEREQSGRSGGYGCGGGCGGCGGCGG